MNSLEDPKFRSLLARLHTESEAQRPALMAFFEQHGPASLAGTEEEVQAGRPFWRDKLVAFDRDKAEFCYLLCRAMNAKRVVEAGTSYGVSTLYLAAAVRDNGGGVVIGTEYEPEKAKAARAHFAESGLADLIELREGDLRQTLKQLQGPIDFMLLDIWTPMVRPAAELVAPHLRPGAVLIADNTASFRDAYADYFAFLSAHGFITRTLPFEGGLEMSVKI
ncbi:MAG TPA: class I SAM-dependent methyltransferase [Rhizomicrobium sp.]|nr:class I SAM-dependent methyltransferase [Rhizomicrobium sp.]